MEIIRVLITVRTKITPPSPLYDVERDYPRTRSVHSNRFLGTNIVIADYVLLYVRMLYNARVYV